MHETTPWQDWLAIAAKGGVGPHDFWRLSVREWRALALGGRSQALTRRELDALIKRFPDGDND